MRKGRVVDDGKPFAKIVALGICLVLGGCATRPGPEALAPVGVAVEGAQIVTVHAATTRQRDQEGANRFTAEPARQTNYAAFAVSVPPHHSPGTVEWPRGRPDPAKSFAVSDQRRLDETDFLDDVVASSRQRGRRAVNVFVHGYNQNFQQALFRLAQMSVDSRHDGAAVLFAWPSQAELAGYVADRDAATYSRDHLVALLTALAGDRRIGEITVVAHSMGAFLTVEALRQLRLTGHGHVLDRLQVVLASPDIDVDVFRAQMEVVGPMNPPLTVLVSSDDRALLASKRVAGGRDRLGALAIADPRVEEAVRRSNIVLVDISSLETSDGLRHGRFALLGAVYLQLEETDTASPGQRLRQAGAYVFNAVGTTLSSPFVLVGDALAAQ